MNSIEQGEEIEQKEQIYADFYLESSKAMAEFEINALRIITEAGKKDWKALAWKLERRFPERWGKKKRHEVTGADNEPVRVENTRAELIEKLMKIKDRKENK